MLLLQSHCLVASTLYCSMLSPHRAVGSWCCSSPVAGPVSPAAVRCFCCAFASGRRPSGRYFHCPYRSARIATTAWCSKLSCCCNFFDDTVCTGGGAGGGAGAGAAVSSGERVCTLWGASCGLRLLQIDVRDRRLPHFVNCAGVAPASAAASSSSAKSGPAAGKKPAVMLLSVHTHMLWVAPWTEPPKLQSTLEGDVLVAGWPLTRVSLH